MYIMAKCSRHWKQKTGQGTAWEEKDLKLAIEGRIHRIKYEDMKRKVDDQAERS